MLTHLCAEARPLASCLGCVGFAFTTDTAVGNRQIHGIRQQFPGYNNAQVE